MFVKINYDPNNQLKQAYMSRDIERFQKLIDSGENPNCFVDGESSLIVSIISNRAWNEEEENKKFFDIVMDSKNYIGSISKNVSDLRASILYQKDIHYMKKILEQNNVINGDEYFMHKRKNNTAPPIFDALKSYDMEKVKLLLSHSPNLKICNENGITVLEYVLSVCKFEWHSRYINLLIEHGADPCQISLNKKGEPITGKTCLHFLADTPTTEKLYPILLKYFDDVDVVDNLGKTPLMHACFEHDVDGVDFLIKNGADVNKQDYSGVTPIMHFFYESDSYVTVMKLFEKFMSTNYDFSICQNGSSNVFHYLVHYCDPNKYGAKIKNFMVKNHELLYQKNINNASPMSLMKSLYPSEYIELKKTIDSSVRSK